MDHELTAELSRIARSWYNIGGWEHFIATPHLESCFSLGTYIPHLVSI